LSGIGSARGLRLLVAATRVKDGGLRPFREHEISLEAVPASACLPLIHHAIEIEGEWYWDGGRSANPPLRQLVSDTRASNILLVPVTP
jgi:NTE family protein